FSTLPHRHQRKADRGQARLPPRRKPRGQASSASKASNASCLCLYTFSWGRRPLPPGPFVREHRTTMPGSAAPQTLPPLGASYWLQEFASSILTMGLSHDILGWFDYTCATHREGAILVHCPQSRGYADED